MFRLDIGTRRAVCRASHADLLRNADIVRQHLPLTMARSVYFTRSMAVLRLRRTLERDFYPRIQMGFIVFLTGGIGLLISFALLQAGIENMAVRYPTSLAGAYLGFLLLLWLWIRVRADDIFDLPNLADLMPDGKTSVHLPQFKAGSGGDFGGGGASGTFDGPASYSIESADSLPSLGDAVGAAADAEELAIPLLAVVLAAGLAFASLYVVYLAPVLFAELLVDGVLSYALYHRLRDTETSHWLMTALRRTIVPFVLTAIFLALVGIAMGAFAPGARSIGEVVRHATLNRAN
mgnify:CR=1 FL=1